MAKDLEFEEDEIPKSNEEEILDELDLDDEAEMEEVERMQEAQTKQPVKAAKGPQPAVRQPAVKKPDLKQVIVENPKTEEQQTQDIGQYILAKLAELEDRMTKMESLIFRQLRQ